MADILVTGSIVIAVIGLLLLCYLGMKYPRGRRDWPHDGPRTLSYIISGILFFIIMGSIYWVTQYWDYPASGKGVVYLAFLALPVLVVLGFVFPKGKKGLLE
ncbi:MAG: hypothetical protein JXA22_10290 [Candidatus Thermoplasmatota archaeon]|nr:hypothetical protein [Candidatus Thermoplasmatota archaeon]